MLRGCRGGQSGGLLRFSREGLLGLSDLDRVRYFGRQLILLRLFGQPPIPRALVGSPSSTKGRRNTRHVGKEVLLVRQAVCLCLLAGGLVDGPEAGLGCAHVFFVHGRFVGRPDVCLGTSWSQRNFTQSVLCQLTQTGPGESVCSRALPDLFTFRRMPVRKRDKTPTTKPPTKSEIDNEFKLLKASLRGCQAMSAELRERAVAYNQRARCFHETHPKNPKAPGKRQKTSSSSEEKSPTAAPVLERSHKQAQQVTPTMMASFLNCEKLSEPARAVFYGTEVQAALRSALGKQPEFPVEMDDALQQKAEYDAWTVTTAVAETTRRLDENSEVAHLEADWSLQKCSEDPTVSNVTASFFDVVFTLRAGPNKWLVFSADASFGNSCVEVSVAVQRRPVPSSKNVAPFSAVGVDCQPYCGDPFGARSLQDVGVSRGYRYRYEHVTRCPFVLWFGQVPPSEYMPTLVKPCILAGLKELAIVFVRHRVHKVVWKILLGMLYQEPSPRAQVLSSPGPDPAVVQDAHGRDCVVLKQQPTKY